MGSLKDFQVDIPIDLQVIPKNLVLYSLKENIEHELEQWVNLGIYPPKASSKLIVPVCTVFKGDSSIHICGDYKHDYKQRQTIYKVANCDKYPIPKTKDIFAKWGGGQWGLTKLDLSQFYQQFLLSSFFLSFFLSYGYQLELRNQRSQVQVWLLAMCRGELSPVISRLMSKCLWSRWKW